MKGTARGGEIVQVQGGHILRSTTRKDRHSKVYTAKGPRDRRVRLSAHTAIQFYDVQDRLGYDRPSKAIDWLIGKAKPAIDRLNHLPTTVGGGYRNFSPDSNPSSSVEHVQEPPPPPPPPPNPEFPPGIGLIHSGGDGGFNPPFELEDAILVNTMKSFFPAADDLGLPLNNFQEGHGSSGNPFQEYFQKIDGWSEGRAGFVTNPTAAAMSSQHQLGLSGFSHQCNTSGEHHHHQLSWNLHRLLAANSMDHQNPGNPFEFGYCTTTAAQGRIYREEEEPDSHV